MRLVRSRVTRPAAHSVACRLGRDRDPRGHLGQRSCPDGGHATANTEMKNRTPLDVSSFTSYGRKSLAKAE